MNADFDNQEIPSDIEECANLALGDLIPEKSRGRYEVAYKKFEEWCQEKKVNTINEKVMMAYFESMKTLKSSTKWTTYSMLKSELKVKKNLDIAKYTTLVALLKRRSTGYQAKKSRIFNKEDFEKFIKDAEDKQFLFVKVAMIIGVAGACRKSELTFLRVQDVVDENTYFRITIPESKTYIRREFVVTKGDISGIDLVDIIRKYINMRPQITKHDRFFVNYRKEKCGVQPVGINTFGNLPKTIAEYLGLPNPSEYTGHCFRRSSASLLADSGADILKIKQHGGWKSNTVAEGYVENSLGNKKRIAAKILGENVVGGNVAKGNVENSLGNKNILGENSINVRTPREEIIKDLSAAELSAAGLNFASCTCSNFVFNVYKS